MHIPIMTVCLCTRRVAPFDSAFRFNLRLRFIGLPAPNASSPKLRASINRRKCRWCIFFFGGIRRRRRGSCIANERIRAILSSSSRCLNSVVWCGSKWEQKILHKEHALRPYNNGKRSRWHPYGISYLYSAASAEWCPNFGGRE